jgi:hypothetical protein
MSLVRRLLWVVFFLEVGILLAVVPWSSYWDRNYFMHSLPWLHRVLGNTYLRGAVSGLGLVNLAAAFADVVALTVALRASWQNATSQMGRP